jgi:hypothetical protein
MMFGQNAWPTLAQNMLSSFILNLAKLMLLESLKTVAEEGVKTLPQVFEEAVKSPLGIIGLMIICLGLLAWGFFQSGEPPVTLLIFYSLLTSAIMLAVAFFRNTSTGCSYRSLASIASCEKHARTNPILHSCASGAFS